MKSIQIRFNKLVEKYPHRGLYSCLTLLVNRKGLGRQAITKLFDELIDKEDFARNERGELIDYLLKLQTKKTVKKDRIITTYNDPCFAGMTQDARLRASSSIER